MSDPVEVIGPGGAARPGERDEPRPATSGWSRLDSRMLLVHPVIELGRAAPALIGLLLAGHGSGHGSWWSLIGAAVVMASATARWFTTRYRITARQIELRHGLVRRRTVAAPLDRVRTVDVTSHALHRVLGLARVTIGTGTSDRRGRPELRLDGLATADADQLRGRLLHRSPVPRPGTEDGEQELVRLQQSWIAFAPFTLSGAVTALAVVGFGWRIATETGTDPARSGPLRAVLDHLAAVPPWRAAAEVTGVSVGFVAAASTVGYVLAFWGFRLTRHPGGTIQVRRGLVTSRTTSIELRRLRGAELSEPLLLRLVGGARTLAITTGLRVGRGAERGGTLLLPPAPRRQAVRIATEVTGCAAAFAGGLVDHGPAAARRRYVRALGGSLAAGALALAGWSVLGLPTAGRAAIVAAAVIVTALAVPVARDRAATLGHGLVDGHLVTAFGSLVRRRTALQAEAVIGWRLRSSPAQRRAGLVTVIATTAAGRQRFPIIDLDQHAALRLAQQVTPGLLEQFLAGSARLPAWAAQQPSGALAPVPAGPDVAPDRAVLGEGDHDRVVRP